MRTIFKPEKLGDLIQAETKALSGLDEAHSGHVLWPIPPNAAERLFRFGQQALALIKPDCLNIDPASISKSADRECCNYFFYTP
mgnify:CR=1 FL=1